MRYGMIALLCACVSFAGGANAHTHYLYHHHHARVAGHRHHRSHDDGESHFAGIHWEDTAAGAIKVADRLADKFKDMIADFVAAGYKPKDIGCFARGGHIRHSRHYLGEACDFDQDSRNKTAKFMYSSEADSIIKKYGFTNGCSFHDCGHVGMDGQGGSHVAHLGKDHYARRRVARVEIQSKHRRFHAHLYRAHSGSA